MQPCAIRPVRMAASAWHPRSVPVDEVTPAAAASSTWTNAPAIYTGVISHPRALTCPAGTTAVANPATGAPCMTAPRARSASISTSATI